MFLCEEVLGEESSGELLRVREAVAGKMSENKGGKMDVLSQEALGKITKKKMRQVIPDLVENITTSYFNLGGMILRVRSEGIFSTWGDEEYESFETWCEEVLKFGLRKAQYLSSIYEGVLTINPKPILRERLLRLGWVKVGQILRIADSKKSLREWVAIAEELTLRQLQDKIRWALKGGTDDGGDELEADLAEMEQTITRKFQLTEKQNTQFDSALEIIRKRFPTATMGEMISMLATNYMAMNVKDDEGGISVELSNVIDNLEAVYGVKLAVQTAATQAKKKKKKKKVG